MEGEKVRDAFIFTLSPTHMRGRKEYVCGNGHSRSISTVVVAVIVVLVVVIAVERTTAVVMGL